MPDSFKPCSVPGCSGNSHRLAYGCKGFCSAHYQRQLHHSGDPLAGGPSPKCRTGRCSADGCKKPDIMGGLCSAHYQRMRRHGNPTAGQRQRGYCYQWLVEHINFQSEECLTWPFARLWNGHGHLRRGGKDARAHRLMCIMVHGDPPSAKHEVAHSCGKAHEGCVNPKHLRWATAKENQADRIQHGTTNRGERSGSAKLTVKDVLRIRSLAFHLPQKAIAEQYGVSGGAVHDIIARKNWAWLD